MREKILDIAKMLYHNHLTPQQATDIIMSSFIIEERKKGGEQ